MVAGRPEGSPIFPPAAAAPRQHLSTLFLSPPPLAGPGSAGGAWEDAGPSVTSPSAVRRAAKRPEGAERHTKNAVSGGGERGRQIRDGNSQPRPLVPPPPPGLGPRPRRQCGRAPAPRASECGRLRSPGPYLTVARLAQPPPAGLAPARGRGAPSLPQPGRKSVRGRRARQLASREKFAAPPRGGAVRRGPPLASAVTAGDFLDSSSARAAMRPAATAGRARVYPRAPAPGAAGELAFWAQWV